MMFSLPSRDCILNSLLGHKANKESCKADPNAVLNATVCVDFVKKDTLMGTSFVENVISGNAFVAAVKTTHFTGHTDW